MLAPLHPVASLDASLLGPQIESSVRTRSPGLVSKALSTIVAFGLMVWQLLALAMIASFFIPANDSPKPLKSAASLSVLNPSYTINDTKTGNVANITNCTNLFNSSLNCTPCELCNSYHMDNLTESMRPFQRMGHINMSIYRQRYLADSRADEKRVRTLLLAVSGEHSDADRYICYLQSVIPEDLRAEVLLVAPVFLEKVPVIPFYGRNPVINRWTGAWRVHGNELYFEGLGWISGELSSPVLAQELNATRMSSFSVLDEMLLYFASPDRLPLLKRVILAGHSAGAELLHRYALGSKAHPVLENAGLTVQYVLGNAASFMFPFALRPHLAVVLPDQCIPDENRTVDTVSAVSQPLRLIRNGYCNISSTTSYAFSMPSLEEQNSCPTYNSYKFGFANLPLYFEGKSAAELLSMYASRDVTYLSSEWDICNRGFELFLDCNTSCVSAPTNSCAPMLQGYCRKERAHTFFQAFTKVVPEHRHRLVQVAFLSHSPCEVLNSPEARAVLRL